MARIIQITPYPLKNRIHGGQIRCHAIATALRSAGHEIMSFALYNPGSYQEADANDIPVPPEKIVPDPTLIYLSDYFMGAYASTAPDILARLKHLFSRFAPEIVLIEQPWLFPAIEKIADNFSFKMIYSSQNVEWRLKQNMLASPAPDAHRQIIEDIRSLEERAVAQSDYVIACTAADSETFRAHTSASKIIIAPNAVEPFNPDAKRVNDWYWHFGKRPYAVFVGSHHLPNANGFWEMLQPGLAFLGPRQKIVIIGGVCDLLFKHPAYTRQKSLNNDRVVLAGYQSRSDLLAILMASSLVLLPITQGEGSNLKTAEALYSAKPILATEAAFRGYGYAITSTNVSIANDSVNYRSKLKELLEMPPLSAAIDPEIRSRVTWAGSLQSLVNLVGTLVPLSGKVAT